MIRVALVASGMSVALALSLTGCSLFTTTNLPTDTSSAAPTPISIPQVTKPTLSQLVVSPDGLGYIEVGKPVPVTSSALAVVVYNPKACPAFQDVTASGAWIATYPKLSEALSAFDLGPSRSSTAPIGLVEVWSSDIRTANGIGVNSTRAQLLAAYGTRLVVDRGALTDAYLLKGTRSELVFEVLNPSTPSQARQDTVLWMRVVPLGTTFLHIYGTDVSGPCPG